MAGPAEELTAEGGPAVPPAAIGIAAGAAALLLAVAPRYGWHRDELYFLEAGRHLAWGYVDQPPFTPFVARLAREVAPGNLVMLRALPAVATAMTIVLGALLVRELGGRRRVQVAGAAALAGGGFVLGVGHLLSTAVFDLTASMAVLWLVARVLRTRDPRWWLAVGGVVGLSMLNKNLVVLLVLALAIGLVADRRWDVLLSPWTVAGAALALAIASPNLLWQADHGWPQADMAEVLSERIGGENRATLVPLQLLFLGPLLVPLLWWGARWLARMDAGRPFRALLWAWPAVLLITFASGGRPYYALPLTLAVGLAGVVEVAQRRDPAWLARLVVPNLLVSLPLALPLLPLSTTKVSATVNEAVAETVGWPELVAQVAGVVADLPAEERERVVLLTGSYGEAGAIDRFGPALGLPPAHSGHNGYGYFRQPTDDGATVVGVRLRTTYLSRHFEECDEVATVDNGFDVENEVQGVPIVVCRGLRGTWDEVWPALRHLS
ncbi:MAG: glycosyltransferase family 39 protein [Acidimicrobiales bacterium]